MSNFFFQLSSTETNSKEKSTTWDLKNMLKITSQPKLKTAIGMETTKLQ